MFRFALLTVAAMAYLATVANAQHCGGYNRSFTSVNHGYTSHASNYVAPFVAPVVYPTATVIVYTPGTPTAAFYAPAVVAAPVVAVTAATTPAPAAVADPAADAEYQRYLKWKAKAAAAPAPVVPAETKAEAPRKEITTAIEPEFIGVLFRR